MAPFYTRAAAHAAFISVILNRPVVRKGFFPLSCYHSRKFSASAPLQKAPLPPALAAGFEQITERQR